MVKILMLCIIQAAILWIILFLIDKRCSKMHFASTRDSEHRAKEQDMAKSVAISLKTGSMMKRFIRCFIYFLIFVSTIKVLTGKASMTLDECFAEATGATWKHYILLTGGFLALLCCSYFWISISEKRNNIWCQIRDRIFEGFFLILGLVLIFTFRVTCLWWTGIFALASVISMVCLLIKKLVINRALIAGIPKIESDEKAEDKADRKIEKSFEDDFTANNRHQSLKNKVCCLLPAVAFCLLLEWVLIPSEIYFGNFEEVKFSLSNWTLSTVVPFLILTVVYLLIWSLFLGDFTVKIGSYFIGAIALAEYIQYMFLNGKMNMLDGTVQTWSNSKIVINLLVWLLIGILIGFTAFIENKKKKQISSVVFSILAAMIFVTSATLFLTKSGEIETSMGFGTEGMLELSPNKNVVYLVLDAFDGSYMSTLLEEHEELYTEFKDFTYYDNATSRYGFTGTGLPYLLTGVEHEGSMTDLEYREYAYEKGEFLPCLSEAGYDVRIYSDEGYFPNSIADMVDNYGREKKQSVDLMESVGLVRKMSKYTSMPFAFKQIYKWGSWDIQNILSKYGYNPWNDRSLYNEICDYGLSVNEEYNRGAFRFYHMQGAHLPFVMNENCEADPNADRYQQCLGVLRIVEKYLEEMKRVGIYDDALIVITADHGAGGVLNVGELTDISHPILLVKYPQQISDRMEVTESAVCQTDLFKTVINYVNEESTTYENDSILTDKFPDDRLRQYTVMYSEYGVTDYLIKGDVHLWDSWELESYVAAGE